MLRPFAILAATLLAAPVLVAAAPEPIVPQASGPYTLLTLSRQLVAMVDAAGDPVRAWTVPGKLGNVLDVELLPSGNLLVTVAGYTGMVTEVTKAPYAWGPEDVVPDPTGSAIVELDAASVPVWTLFEAGGVPLHWTHDVDYLAATDTFLVADTTSSPLYADRVVEVDRAGNVLWAWYPPEGSYPNDADRLPNGNTLVSLRNLDRVVEVAPDGSLAWSLGPGAGFVGQHNPDRLANGNTIVADSEGNRILEFDPSGSVVWSFGGPGILRWPRDADRLPNGNTLVTDSQNNRVLEVDPAGTVVWQMATPALVLNYDSDRVNDAPAVVVHAPAEGAVVGSPVAFHATASDPSLAGATYRLFDETLGFWLDAAPEPLPGAPWTRALPVGHAYRIEVAAWDSGGEGGGWPQDDSVPRTTTVAVRFTVGA